MTLKHSIVPVSYTHLDVNYLCVPSEFVGFTFQYLYEQNLDNVGIIEYRNKPTYYKEDLMLLKIPRYNTGNGACLLYTSNVIFQNQDHQII